MRTWSRSVVVFLLAIQGGFPASAAIYDSAGVKLPDHEASGNRVAWRPFERNNVDGISGVGVLGDHLVGDICTASLIDSGHADGPAYILTNGHCNFFAHYGFDALKATEVREDRSTKYHVTFNHYMGTPAHERRRYKLKRLTYVTEHLTDVAIFEVDARLATLERDGIRPLKLSRFAPIEGTPVQLIGIPLLYVHPSQKSLHTSDCWLGHTVALRNGIYSAPESFAHKCDSLPGFSGGPLISRVTGEIVLLNSHGTADDAASAAPCAYESRPCEVNADGSVVVRPELSYGQRVDTIAGCFDATGRFSLRESGCGLSRSQ